MNKALFKTTALSLIMTVALSWSTQATFTLQGSDVIGEEETLTSIASKSAKVLQIEKVEKFIGIPVQKNHTIPYYLGVQAVESDLKDFKSQVISSSSLAYPQKFLDYETALKGKIKSAFDHTAIPNQLEEPYFKV